MSTKGQFFAVRLIWPNTGYSTSNNFTITLNSLAVFLLNFLFLLINRCYLARRLPKMIFSHPYECFFCTKLWEFFPLFFLTVHTNFRVIFNQAFVVKYHILLEFRTLWNLCDIYCHLKVELPITYRISRGSSCFC